MGQYSCNGFVVVSVKKKGAHHDQDHQNSILPSGTSNCRKPSSYGTGRPGRPRGRGSRRNLRPRRSRDGGDNRRQYAASTPAHGRLRAAAHRSRIRYSGHERPVRQCHASRLFAGAARCLRSATSSASALVLPPSATAPAAALASSATPSHAACTSAPASCASAPTSRWTAKAISGCAQKIKRGRIPQDSTSFDFLGYLFTSSERRDQARSAKRLRPTGATPCRSSCAHEPR